MAVLREQLGEAALIVGCGYLGRRIAARLLALGQAVYGTTRSPVHAASLAGLGVKPLFLSVTELITTASLHGVAAIRNLDVYYLIPPGRPPRHGHGGHSGGAATSGGGGGGEPTPREVVLDGMSNVLATLKPERVRRAVMASSTAVYPQTEGETVSADTPIALDDLTDPRARLLFEGELLWQRAGFSGTRVRLAGLYGPDRIVGLKAVREGQPLVGNPASPLNLIHVDDAASLMIAIAAMPQPHPVELGCDDQPTARLDYYTWLAARLGVPTPRLLTEAEVLTLGLNPQNLKKAASKRCDNTPTCQRTGWRPQYPSFIAGLEPLLSTHAAYTTGRTSN